VDTWLAALKEAVTRVDKRRHSYARARESFQQHTLIPPGQPAYSTTYRSENPDGSLLAGPHDAILGYIVASPAVDGEKPAYRTDSVPIYPTLGTPSHD